jgi:FtsP/CotA-like multicopper oxidase with cupredoxin domain
MIKLMKIFIGMSISIFMLANTYAATKENANKSIELVITQKNIDVDGKKTWVYYVSQPNGTWGFEGVKGQYFDATVKNETTVPTVLHWHGLIVPNDQDGVPYVTQAPIPPGGTYHYHFKLLQAGTFWMHSHFGLQVQRYMSAPFIIHDPNDKSDAQDVVMMLADYSPKTPDAIFAELKKGMPMNTSAATKQKMAMPMNDNKSMSSMQSDNSMAQKPDLNDVKYDAYLTNYQTLKNPPVIRVQPGKTVRLRIINGAAMSGFFVNTGKLPGQLIAVDGNDIHPINGTQFQISEAQRLDILVKIPEQKDGVYPILAQGEGTNMQTGLILATPEAKTIPTYPEKVKNTAGSLDYSQEWQLKALYPLTPKPVDETLTLNLEGDMAKYEWKINNQMWPHITPLSVHNDRRVEMIINNQTDMAHPIHLHGHTFEVTEIDGKPVTDGAMRDTVFVMPHSTVKVQFDSDNPGKWVVHCHMLYHQEAGMMTEIDYAK